MKRLISATLALSLLGVTAASAAPYGYDRQGYGYDSQYRDDSYRHDNNGAAIAAGVGFLALAAGTVTTAAMTVAAGGSSF